MSKMEFGNGLANHPGYKREKIAIFFDNNLALLEVPSLWMMTVAKLKSRSSETSRNYAHILSRYLNWLDEVGYGSQSWQLIDEEIFYSYLLYLTEQKVDGSFIQHDTLLHYACRILDFYTWAKLEGYPHHLEIGYEQITHKLDTDQYLFGHTNSLVLKPKPHLNLPTGQRVTHHRELDKFVTQSDFEAAIYLLEDRVFQIIATIIRVTGMRPKDLLQLPYRGKGRNAGFIPYDPDEMNEDIDLPDIYYEFESKGKVRSIAFPGKLWRVICEIYLPLRRQRASIYFEKQGISPPNSALFLTAGGNIVTYQILHYHFSKVVINAAKSTSKIYKGRRFNSRMLRHTCATYFVYEALKQKNRLGHSFVYDAALDEELRGMLGHNDIKTTLQYYVHLVNRFVYDDLLQDLKRVNVDAGLSAILNFHNYADIE